MSIATGPWPCTIFINNAVIDINNNNNLTGDALSMLDVHLWPHFCRVGFIRDDTGIDAFPAETFPKLAEYEKTMWKHPAVNATSGTLEGFKRFVITYLQGDPDFDFGINE